jgi:uncharacterized protein (DUF111 family)
MSELVAERGLVSARATTTHGPTLRAVLGRVSGAKGQGSGGNDWETDTVAVLETNLDDINAEILGNFVEKAFSAGALDVFHTPIQMKKNRPGVLLTVLCVETDADKFAELILRETSSFGVRCRTAARRKLRREFASVKTPFGNLTVKVGNSTRVLQAAPEFESCKNWRNGQSSAEADLRSRTKALKTKP